MKVQMTALFIVFIILVSSTMIGMGYSGSSEEERYIKFLERFFPDSPDYCMDIHYLPGGIIHTLSDKVTQVTLIVEKTNISVDIDFNLRFMITRGFWVPYSRPGPSPAGMSFTDELRKFNEWLNVTSIFTKNVATVSPKDVHFEREMSNMTVHLKFTVHGWGNDWGVMILARESNATLWLPVGGIPISVEKNSSVWNILPYIYTASVTALLVGVSYRCRVRVRK